jgi:hypothetical protein
MDPDQHLDGPGCAPPSRRRVRRLGGDRENGGRGTASSRDTSAGGIARRVPMGHGRGVRQGARRPTGDGTVGGARVRRAGRRGGLSRPRAGSLHAAARTSEAFRSGLALRGRGRGGPRSGAAASGGIVLTISSSSTVESILRSGGTGVGHRRGQRVRRTNAPGTRRASGEHRAT